MSFTDDADNPEGPVTSDPTDTVVADARDYPSGTIWCEIMTVGSYTVGTLTVYGYDGLSGELDNRRFDYESTTNSVNIVTMNVDTTSMTPFRLQLSLEEYLPLGSVFQIDGTTFRADAASRSISGRHTWYLSSDPDRRDGQEMTLSIKAPNTTATGTPEITGTAQVGEELTATLGTIADEDGLATTFPDDYTFEWTRVDGLGSEEEISGAMLSTYTLVAADVNKKIKVQLSFTDGAGYSEGPLASDPYPAGNAKVTPSVDEPEPGLKILGGKRGKDKNGNDVDRDVIRFSGTSSNRNSYPVGGTETKQRCVSPQYTLTDADGTPVAGNIIYSLEPRVRGRGEPPARSDYPADADVPSMFEISSAGQIRTKVGVDYAHTEYWIKDGWQTDPLRMVVMATKSDTGAFAMLPVGAYVVHPARTDSDGFDCSG